VTVGQPERVTWWHTICAVAAEPGGELALFVALHSPAGRDPNDRVLFTRRAFDVRLEVAGSRRTQRLIVDEPLRASCARPTGRR
jgi:hypothetical protein